jgi:hypothetical protein
MLLKLLLGVPLLMIQQLLPILLLLGDTSHWNSHCLQVLRPLLLG